VKMSAPYGVRVRVSSGGCRRCWRSRCRREKVCRHGCGRAGRRRCAARAVSAAIGEDGEDRSFDQGGDGGYETLRQQVVGTFDGEPRDLSLALLLRQGMRAWMKGWVRWLSTSASECRVSPTRSWSRAEVRHADLVVVLASMVRPRLVREGR
jgi:hypothetical protein